MTALQRPAAMAMDEKEEYKLWGRGNVRKSACPAKSEQEEKTLKQAHQAYLRTVGRRRAGINFAISSSRNFHGERTRREIGELLLRLLRLFLEYSDLALFTTLCVCTHALVYSHSS